MNEINRKCKEGKKWLQEKCEGIGRGMIVGRADSVYIKVKTTFGEVESKGSSIKCAMGVPLLNADEGADKWKEYIEGLYEGEELSDNVTEKDTGVDIEELGDPI